jgi:hypothetical protein
MTDIEIILSHRHDNGADFWATPDGRLAKGHPFSTYWSSLMLLELGMPPSDPILTKVAELFFEIQRPDGRFKLLPSGTIYPCHSAYAAGLLCRLGYVSDERIQTTLRHFLATPYQDGGWRCNKFLFGRGPKDGGPKESSLATEYSNPLPTLNILDAFRFSHYLNNEPALDAAVEFLLNHWTLKKPIGPCQYGIGSRFMQIEYPLPSYNLFNYLYILSFYDYAKQDPRFKQALQKLENKMIDDQIVIERSSPKLSKLEFCKKGRPSLLATKRYFEMKSRLKGG